MHMRNHAKHLSQWSLTFEVRNRELLEPDPGLVKVSQWSLTFEVRKRGLHIRATHPDPMVAMEPDL